ncbi:MAG TPA: sodium:proton antiporter [Glaciihabitans sp.]|jgi:CPA1 family monovalent cation:H+ antiporter|nr:sodium:proton antiporter [Glaciihabitans sp.]
MELALFGVVGIITIVAAGYFSQRLGIAAPLLLIVVGVGFSYLPGAPTTVPPELILGGILPVLLYSSAVRVPVVDLRRNLSSISALSVVLVFVTAFITGLILYWIFPDLSLAAGIAIGAVISPTDAVAATALGKKLGLPPRLITILEGEGLVNDASALVLLRSAVAAVAATVTFWAVVADFVFAVAVAVLVGLVVGWATVWVRARLVDSVLDTAISFAVPFIAFVPAEHFGASGVIAVVVAGLYSGHHSARRLTAGARISERLNWRTVQFVLENGVFLLMGLEISTIIGNVEEDELSAPRAIAVGLLMVVVVIIIRFAFLVPLLVILRRQLAHAEHAQTRFRAMLDSLRDMMTGPGRSRQRHDRAEAVYQRRQYDIAQLKAEGLGWRGGAVLGWSGMRGVVTLAAAQSLPSTIDYRAQLILIAFTVAVVTLLVQGGTLPLFIRMIGIRPPNADVDRREFAQLLEEVADAGLAVLESRAENFPDEEPIDPEVLARVRRDTLVGPESAWERVEQGVGEAALPQSPKRLYRQLRLEVLRAEREALLVARSDGQYTSRALVRAQAMLDLEETRLEQIDNPHDG